VSGAVTCAPGAPHDWLRGNREVKRRSAAGEWSAGRGADARRACLACVPAV